MRPEKLSVHVDGADHELFMSYGLLTRLTSIAVSQGLTEGTFGADGIARDAMIMACMEKRGKTGFLEIKDDFSFDDLDLTPAEAEKIFDWAAGHVTDFFMRRVAAGTELIKPYADQLKNSTSLMSGTEASASMTPSPGPSEPSPAS